MWQNSGHFTKYMWNRYKLEEDLNSNLVIYFNASTQNSEELFISIGLIDDKLNEYEKNNSTEIYEFLEDECKKISCDDFHRQNTGWGERVFTVIDENNYENIDYDCILTKLKEVYEKAINKFYIIKNNNEEQFKIWLQKKGLADSTIQKYINRLKKTIPEKLREINNLHNVQSLFDIEYEEVKNIYSLLQRDGELYEWNISTLVKSEASAATGNYLEYLKRSIDTNTNTGITMKNPLNQILYGPPGTGKTYNTINKALKIIDGFVADNREEAKERFEALKEDGQIEFVTFHQSYGYEEFVEGIKAKTTDEGIEYKIEPGIFNKMAKEAKINYENSQKTATQLKKEKTLKQKLEIFLNDSIENEQEFSKTKGGKFKIKEVENNDISIYTEDSNYSDKSLTLQINEFLAILESNIELKTSRQLAQDIFGINNQRQKDTYYLSLYKAFNQTIFTNLDDTEPVETLKNYILIIDEINRGNISKIFGELITLIEESKRLGNNEAMVVTLPYSAKEFSVPKNLYIIGTMNTADRSIALMDTALRRRFEFEEMMPKPELLGEVEGINLDKLLTKINQRIEYLYDRDHTIGHAYFIDIEEKEALDSAMRNKVIPLLQEYFYDDWEKIQLVLNDGFISKVQQSPNDIFGAINDEFVDEEKYSYDIVEDVSEEAYRKIYE